MKSAFLLFLPAALMALTASAQVLKPTNIWRCGNAYTNDAAEAKAKGCKPVEGGNVTVVEGTKVLSAAPSSPGTAKSAASGERVAAAPTSSGRPDSAEQRARDADARAILEQELKKAEAKYADLQKEYNNGEPEKLGPETRNHQKYLDRVAELKASISRTEQDIAGIKRELARLAPPVPTVSGGTVPASK